jgi:hypothetical protein
VFYVAWVAGLSASYLRSRLFGGMGMERYDKRGCIGGMLRV